jgi:hypothetical protein
MGVDIAKERTENTNVDSRHPEVVAELAELAGLWGKR